MSRPQHLGHKHSVLVANESFENVAKLKYLHSTVQVKTAFTKKLRAA